MIHATCGRWTAAQLPLFAVLSAAHAQAPLPAPSPAALPAPSPSPSQAARPPDSQAAIPAQGMPGLAAAEPAREPASAKADAAADARLTGKPSLELSGFVAAQVMFDSNAAVKQNHLISVDGAGDTGKFGWAFDATRLNLQGQLSAGGFAIEGRAEVDMQSAIFFRIRHAYAAISKRGTMLLLGQTDTLVGNYVGPHNFNNDWMFAQGNAYDRLPQLRVSHDTGRFLIAAALLPNLHGVMDVIPHGQARVLVRFAKGHGLLGAAGHFGYSNRVKTSSDPNREVNGVLSYLGSLDAEVGLGPVTISAQVWAGAGAAHGTGGHAIGNPLFVLAASGDPLAVPAAGGFVDLLLKLGARLALGAAGGASVVLDRAPGGTALPMADNTTAVLYASFALRPSWVFAIEAQGARTTRALDSASPTVYTSLYDGRLLFGQRYGF